MQNTILDLLSWGKLLKNQARRVTSIEAQENLLNVGGKLEEMADALTAGTDPSLEKVDPQDIGQALLRLWRTTNEQEWRYSTINVLGDEANQVSMVVSMLRDAAENLLKGDYVVPDKPLKRENVEALMNPIGFCKFCKRVIEARAGYCPLCRKQVKPKDVLEVPWIKEHKPEFIKDDEIVDFDSLAPSTIFEYNAKRGVYECIQCGEAPYTHKKTKDPQCRDIKECPFCGLKDKTLTKGPLPYAAPLKPSSKSDTMKDLSSDYQEKRKIKKLERGRPLPLGENHPCPTEGINCGRTNSSTLKGPREGRLKWSVKLAKNLTSSPVVDENGFIYLGVMGAGFVQITPEGRQGWTFSMDDNITNSAMIDSKNSFYITIPNKTYKLNSDGTPRWMTRIGSSFSPALDGNGSIVLMSEGELYCLNFDSTIRWHKTLSNDAAVSEVFYTVPAIDKQNNIYVSLDHLYALNNGGELLFKAPLIKKGSMPVIGLKNTVLVSSENRITAFKSNGDTVWNYEINNYITTPPALSVKGCVLFGSKNGILYCLSDKGSKIWEFTADDSINNAPVADKDGNVYFTTQSGKVYSLSHKGEEQWSIKPGSGLFGSCSFNSSLIIGCDETGFLSGDDGKLYAIV